jgi:hypothetical protein
MKHFGDERRFDPMRLAPHSGLHARRVRSRRLDLQRTQLLRQRTQQLVIEAGADTTDLALASRGS